MTLTEDLLQAALSANDDRKVQALRVLRGDVETSTRPVTGPLLLGMGAAANFAGVSRSTLWRILQAGTIERVQLFPGSYRVRRADIEALAAGQFGTTAGYVSRRGRPRQAGKNSNIDGAGIGAITTGREEA